MNIKKRKQALLDSLRIPVIGAPLFIVSNPKLVIEQCKAGIIGSFPALNARTEEDLEKWMIEINEELENYKKKEPDKKIAPYAVNQIVHQSNTRLRHDVEMCVKYKAPIVITNLCNLSVVLSGNLAHFFVSPYQCSFNFQLTLVST